ncbi:amidohydrolase [Brucella suis bv. 2]|nr:amidohydrolase [Brucella suis bv. 2]
MLYRKLIFLIIIAFSASLSTQSAIAESIERILFNGRIFTANSEQPLAQAMAIKDGYIFAVGSNEEILTYKTANTELLDLQNKWVLPGLIDAHSHAIIGALAELSPNLQDEVVDLATLKQRIEGWFKQSGHGSGQPFVVFGANPALWSDPQILADIFNKNRWKTQPLLLMGSDLHTAWANGAMLHIAGIDDAYVQNLSDHQRHIIGVTSKGSPDGVLIDAGVDLVTVHLPKPDDEMLLKAGQYAVHMNNSYGITGWMDPAANAGPGEALFSRKPASLGTGILPAYKLLAEKGQLTAHVAALLVASPLSDAADLERLDTVRQQFAAVPNLTMPGIKIFADGVLEFPAQSAALLGHYKNSGKQGEMLLTAEGLKNLVDAADEKGMLVHIHALGDRAVKQSLDAFEIARKKSNSGISHSITHLQLVDPNDYPRFAALNIMPVMQLHWAEMDNYLLDLVKPFINETDFWGQYPARSLQKNGAVIAGASDWPISTANPWEAMHHAMTREGPDGGLNKAERLDLNTMLLAYTIHAAKAAGIDDKAGSLTKGKQADFIIVDRDIFNVSYDLFKNTKVLQTYFAGKLVYSLN